MNVKGDSNIPEVPAVFGENTAGGDGIVGKGRRGVVGQSDTFQGVFGESTNQAGVAGFSTNFIGVLGESFSPANAGQPGVFGRSPNWHGVHGESTNQAGVVGISTNFVGVWGQSPDSQGVHGESTNQAGVAGFSTNFIGVLGESFSPANAGQPGVFGRSPNWHGVHGESTNQAGVVGISTNFVGVWGESQRPDQPGVFGRGPKLAGRFEGDVEVTGDIRLLNADCAEDFDIANGDLVEPGTVMVLGDEGKLQPSESAYDKRVAGVISGAGDFKPGIVLDKQQKRTGRQPIALLGKVYCKVDASYAPVAIGDLLTTSPTPGHAMKATDQIKAFGAVIGKALCPLGEGQGLIPVLIALQ